MSRFVFASVFASLLLVAPVSQAQVEVSVTLTGPVEEILPILDLLKDLGIGVESTGGGIPAVEVHSAYSDSEEEAEPEPDPAADPAPAAQPEPAPEPEPEMPKGPAFSDFQVTPDSASAGQQVFVSVKLDDPEGVVDTVAFTVGELEGTNADLYDNGSNGDKTAGDGVWSLALPVPALPLQSYTLNLVGYDRFAQPVQIETADGPVPLQARTQVEVVN